jgi:hypothetical protein
LCDKELISIIGNPAFCHFPVEMRSCVFLGAKSSLDGVAVARRSSRSLHIARLWYKHLVPSVLGLKSLGGFIMKRIPMAILLIVFVSGSIAAQKTAIKCPPPSKLKDITSCPSTGCGPSLDPNLNEQKNIPSDDQEPVVKTLKDLKDLPDPVPDFKIGDNREKLKALGEGNRVTVVAYALVARKGSKESCNCGLTAPKDTDNHIVLVEEEALALTAKATPAKKATAAKKAVKARSAAQNTLDLREEESETAEFTPRVRLDHPKLAGARLQSLIAAAPEQALLVRVTGLLMFDSEHSLGHHLKRGNDWEIHPVMKMEFCPQDETCTADSSNWKDLENQP